MKALYNITQIAHLLRRDMSWGQIPNRSTMSERPAFIGKRLQVCHWECDNVIGANHKQAIVTEV